MANECMNYIKITGRPEEITLFKESYLYYDEEKDHYDFNFNYITPIPKDCEDDYSFRITHWGNKWNGAESYVEVCDDEVFIDVATAWNPCTPIVDKLINLCPGLEFEYKYYESGCGFVGYRYHVSYDDPDDDEQDEITAYEDPYGYWTHMFIEGYENYDWLLEHIEDLKEDGEIAEELAEELTNLISTENDAFIVERCLEEGVL